MTSRSSRTVSSRPAESGTVAASSQSTIPRTRSSPRSAPERAYRQPEQPGADQEERPAGPPRAARARRPWSAGRAARRARRPPGHPPVRRDRRPRHPSSRPPAGRPPAGPRRRPAERDRRARAPGRRAPSGTSGSRVRRARESRKIDPGHQRRQVSVGPRPSSSGSPAAGAAASATSRSHAAARTSATTVSRWARRTRSDVHAGEATPGRAGSGRCGPWPAVRRGRCRRSSGCASAQASLPHCGAHDATHEVVGGDVDAAVEPRDAGLVGGVVVGRPLELRRPGWARPPRRARPPGSSRCPGHRGSTRGR